MVETLQDPALRAELEAVFRWYAGLAGYLDLTTGLGGKLLCARELNPDSFRLVRASNIAGAGSLSATADPELQKRAVREGVVDFLVTSLDEALRILKNEIRKRRGVAVGIGLSSDAVEQEMMDRGVLPDLVSQEANADAWTKRGSITVAMDVPPPEKTLVALAPPAGRRQQAAEIEAVLLDCLAKDDFASRRWLTMSGCYLDPRLRHFRSFPCDASAVDGVLERVDRKLEELANS